MDYDYKIAVIIAAAGKGERIGKAVPKQFISIKGKEILEHTINVFRGIEMLDVFLALPEEFVDGAEAKYKVKKVVAGGKTRQESVYNAFKCIDAEQYKWVLVHDAARPFLSAQLLGKVLDQTMISGSAVPVLELSDTVKTVSEDTVTNTLERDTLRAVQTPQGFEYGILKKAFDRANDEDFTGNDESALLERIGESVYTVQGEKINFKITTEEDLDIAKIMMGTVLFQKVDRENDNPSGNIRPRIRVGTGFDVHKIVSGREMIIGGVNMPSPDGLMGHSDADVLTHAIMDAILGAAGLPDIGINFPNNDEKYRDIFSIKLLEQVGNIIREKGGTIVNIDATLIGERPRIAPYREEMISNISKALRIDPKSVSIKGTTTEKLGFLGREEGVAAEAVVLVEFF